MTLVVWVIAHELDRRRIPPNVQDAVWLEIPSKTMRGGDNARDDNHHLRRVLDDLLGVQLSGEYRGDPWGAVLVAEWHIEQGGAVTRILVPPAAIRACRTPNTFAQIETYAAHTLTGYAKRLYGDLADKKRLGNPYWIYDLPELWRVLDVEEKKSYHRFNNLRSKILIPTIKEINDFGTVHVTMTPIKLARAVSQVRFDWTWKTLDQARVTDEENQQPKAARHMDRKIGSAPPLTEQDQREVEIEADKARYRAWLEENPKGSFMEYINQTSPNVTNR